MYHASSLIPIYFLFPDQNFVKSGEFEVEVFGTRYPAQCRLNPPVLPKKVWEYWILTFICSLIQSCAWSPFSNGLKRFFCVLAIYLFDTMRHSFHILVTGHVGGSRRLPSHQTLVSPLGCSHVGDFKWATIPSWPIKCCSQSSSLAVRNTNR